MKIDTLYDYFNLCGEEYLFFRKGYIYPEVWESWVSGMKKFYGKTRIQELWLEDLEENSYYNFNIAEEIKKLFEKNHSKFLRNASTSTEAELTQTRTSYTKVIKSDT